jgi:hypothetical protein
MIFEFETNWRIRGILEEFFLYFETNRIGQKRKSAQFGNEV